MKRYTQETAGYSLTFVIQPLFLLQITTLHCPLPECETQRSIPSRALRTPNAQTFCRVLYQHRLDILKHRFRVMLDVLTKYTGEQTMLEMMSKEVTSSLVFHFNLWGGWQDRFQGRMRVFEDIDPSVGIPLILEKWTVTHSSVYA